MASSHFSLLLLLFFFLQQPFSSIANHHKINTLLQSNLSEVINHTLVEDEISPTLFFEVTKPIKLPNTEPCTLQVLHHQFANTYGKPLVTADYDPPDDCPYQDFSKIVLEWSATCDNKQLHQTIGVWLDGVELLRSSTPQPLPNGAVWTIKKDITRYYSLLTKKKPGLLAVYLGNVVDESYTGVFDVTITVHFYPAQVKPDKNFRDGNADLIKPLSRNWQFDDALWFHIKHATDLQSTQFEIPQNVYKAVLEVYVSSHEDEEFWYANFPGSDIDDSNRNSESGDGPFREVLVYLGLQLVGAVWPFTVVYNGGVNPNLWRPITGIGSFNFPSYDIDITPFLGTMLDGEMHEISFGVTNALNVWYIDANLHLWLDRTIKKTTGRLLMHAAPPLRLSCTPHFEGSIAKFKIMATRSISSKGSIQSSYGSITSSFDQSFNYINSMSLGNDGNSQIVDQLINIDQMSSAKENPSSNHLTTKSLKHFHIYLSTNKVDQRDDTYVSQSKLTLLFDEKNYDQISNLNTPTNSVHNKQSVQGTTITKKNSIIGGSGSAEQEYTFSSDVDSCYSRRINSENYIILQNEESGQCERSMPID